MGGFGYEWFSYSSELAISMSGSPRIHLAVSHTVRRQLGSSSVVCSCGCSGFLGAAGANPNLQRSGNGAVS